MTIKILINGAHGKMGQITVTTLNQHPAFQLVGTIGKDQRLAEEIEKTCPDIVIDFTHAGVVFQNTETILKAKIRPVIGTSGLLQPEVSALQALAVSQGVGGIIAPNFSLGAVLLMKAAQDIVKYYPDVEIIEMHHPQKLDSPSGTAVRTAELLSDARGPQVRAKPAYRETIPGALGASYQNIPIHAVRLSGFLAHQQIIFGGQGETLTLRHDTSDRQCFMSGVVLACRKVMGLKTLVYGLEHIL